MKKQLFLLALFSFSGITVCMQRSNITIIQKSPSKAVLMFQDYKQSRRYSVLTNNGWQRVSRETFEKYRILKALAHTPNQTKSQITDTAPKVTIHRYKIDADEMQQRRELWREIRTKSKELQIDDSGIILFTDRIGDIPTESEKVERQSLVDAVINAEINAEIGPEAGALELAFKAQRTAENPTNN